MNFSEEFRFQFMIDDTFFRNLTEYVIIFIFKGQLGFEHKLSFSILNFPKCRVPEFSIFLPESNALVPADARALGVSSADFSGHMP